MHERDMLSAGVSKPEVGNDQESYPADAVLYGVVGNDENQVLIMNGSILGIRGGVEDDSGRRQRNVTFRVSQIHDAFGGTDSRIGNLFLGSIEDSDDTRSDGPVVYVAVAPVAPLSDTSEGIYRVAVSRVDSTLRDAMDNAPFWEGDGSFTFYNPQLGLTQTLGAGDLMSVDSRFYGFEEPEIITLDSGEIFRIGYDDPDKRRMHWMAD